MARINEFRKARRGRRASLIAAALLLAVAALQVGTSSAIVPADLVDTYADAGHVTPTDWFARGDTVYMRGGTAGSTRSWRFTVTDPTGALVHDSGCQVSDLSGNGFDTYVLPATAVLGAAAGYTETFTEYGPATDCSGRPVRPARSHSFRVAQLYAFNNTTDQGNCGGATPGAFWSAVPCANALTSFTTGSQIYVRVLGLEPGVVDVSTLWDKPSGVDCANTGGSDRPDTNATDGKLDTAYPPVLPETGDNPAFCLTPTELGAWRLNLAGPATAAGGPMPRPGVQSVSLAAFTITAQQTPTVSTTIHDSGHLPVTTVAVGTNVHDFVSVSGGMGNPVPTGSVTVDWFLNGTCDGRPNSTSTAATLDSAGTADVTGFNFTPTAGDRAFRAHYSGGGVYAAADGPCEKLQVVDANIHITPPTDTNPVGTNHVLTITVNAVNGTIDAGPHTATASIAGPGSFVPAVGGDTCTYTGGGASANCQVTITSSTAGTSVVSASSTIPVSGVSMSRTTSGTGSNSVPANKYWADDTVTTIVRDAAGNDITNTTVGGAAVVHDEATVTRTPGTPAEVGNPTGSVDFTLYDNGTCNGDLVDTDTDKPLVNGTATSDPFAIPVAVGTYSYLAHYDGDGYYPAHDGPCEPFSFDGVAPVTTITLDPAQPDVCCWYTFAVKPTVSATDVGTGVLETRCVLDPTTPPTSFADLPSSPMCPYLAPSSWVVTEGIHTLYAGSIDKAVPGNTDLVQVTFKIDKTPPTSQVDPLPQFQPNPGPFTVSWSGMDNLSGIKDFDVRYRTASAGGSFGPYTQWFTDTPLTSASFTPTPGSTVCFSVRARDRACWQQFTYSPEVCTTAPYDDPSLTRTGYWSTVSGSGYFGPGVSRSTSPGNKLTLTGLRASVIGVLVTKQPGGGSIELRWNGSTKLTTSLSAGSVQKKQLLTFTLPSVQTGTLEIVQTGYGTVDIDAAGAYKAS